MNTPDPHVLNLLAMTFEQIHVRTLAESVDGLRLSHHRFLSGVPTEGTITVTELADRVGMTKQAAGKFVTRLAEGGFVVTESDPNDRRVRLVRRTAAGNAATQRLVELLGRVEREWAARIGEQRYRQFRTTLVRIASQK